MFSNVFFTQKILKRDVIALKLWIDYLKVLKLLLMEIKFDDMYNNIEKFD